ncbi:hypothetical protein PYW07_010048 [Mythimna separata]|uniref:MICOS complex subunit MIC60 n=1 Tax=Mythimna separata TaxID=271217 RepID=A0AAD7YIB4_MYTSE|nr:hypothetical protein PYW07_010048 [Mythimna separata]
MYRFTNHLANTKLILVRRHLSDGSTAALIVVRSPNRQYATQPFPEDCKTKTPPKSHKLFWGVVGATVLTGAAVVYAKNSPQARNYLESHAPWANDIVALVYQENTTYWKAASNQFNKTTTWLSHFMFGKEGVTPMEVTPRSAQDIEKDAKTAYAKKEYQLPPPILEPLYVEEKVLERPEIETTATLVQTDKCEPQSAPEVKITKDIVELEHDMHEYTKVAIDNYKLAAQSCADYNRALFQIVEASFVELDKTMFTHLQGHQQQRDMYFKKAKEACTKAKCAIETLDRMITSGSQVKAPPESLTTTKRYIKQLRSDLINAENRYNEEIERSVLSNRYWNKVEASRNMFKDELKALYPGIDLAAKKLDIKSDVDLLLVYSLSRIQHLQNQIAELQTVREMKIERAIACRDEKEIINAKAEDIVRTERMAAEVEFMKKTLQIQAEANRNMRDQLKKQAEIQAEVLQDSLVKKEKEIMATFNRAVSEKIEAERVVFKKELAAMAGKLQAIEQTLKQRAASETEARRSQSLWAAAEALLAATRRAAPAAKLDNELKALEKAGSGDLLVQSVLKGIPDEVRQHGIATEKALRERFEKLEETAAKVALVGREGASLPVYFLSWLQSVLLFKKFAGIPEDELANKPTDFTKLDTFDIIQRARYHMDHGNLPAALRYVNLLQGAPRAAAQCWVRAALRHLEVKQAAETVMAHASVSGLLYL